MLRRSKANPGAFTWPVAFTLAAFFAALIILIIFWRIESWPARTARQSAAEMERIGKQLRSAFIDLAHLEPRVTINNRVYLEATRPVEELVVLSRTIEVEHELFHTWIGSSKRVKLHGTFNAKAGFDLQEGVSVDIQPEQIVVRLPRARILGLEQEQVEVLAFENGLWNRISGQDVEGEFSILPKLAREKAEASGLSAEAERVLQQQLQERIHASQPLRVIFGSVASNKGK